MKLCKDCMHYEQSHMGIEYDKCTITTTIDPVRGIRITKYCDFERTAAGECKLEGNNYVRLQ